MPSISGLLVLVIVLPLVLAFGAYKGLEAKDISYASKGAIIFASFALGQILAFASVMQGCYRWGCLVYSLVSFPLVHLIGLEGLGKIITGSSISFSSYLLPGLVKLAIFALIGAVIGWMVGREDVLQT